MTIDNVVSFPIYRDEDWLFRGSVSNGKNIMIFASNPTVPNSFKIRFFTDVQAAKDWVEDVKSGKIPPETTE